MTSQASRSLDAAYGEYLASRSSSASRTPSMQASPAVYPSASRASGLSTSSVSACRKCADAIEHLESTGALSSSVEAEKQQLENFIERSRSRSPSSSAVSRGSGASRSRSPSSRGSSTVSRGSGASPSSSAVSRGSSLSPSPAVMRQIDQIFASTEEPSSVRSAPVAATSYSRSRSPIRVASARAASRSPSRTMSPVRASSGVSPSSGASRGSGVSPSPAVMQQVSQILSGPRAASPSRSSPARTAAVQDVDRILRSASASGRSSSPARSASPGRATAKIVRQVTNPDTGAEGQIVRRADGELRYYIDGEMVTQEVFEAELGY